MNRILGIDYGEKRIGLALSDELGWTAQPYRTLEVKNRMQVCEEIYKVIAEHEVATLVLGLPLSLDGREGPQVLKVRGFARQLDAFLKKREPILTVEIAFMDERLSTAEAERVLIDADLSRRRRREVIDKQAACVMLQGYLQLAASKQEV